MTMHCGICKAPFDEVTHSDCGGDCALCMAEFDDFEPLLRAIAPQPDDARRVADVLRTYLDGLEQ